jgi:hypothetical protein
VKRGDAAHSPLNVTDGSGLIEPAV